MLRKAKKGQSLIEYGLIIALVAIVAVTVVGQMATTIQSTGNEASSQVSAAISAIQSSGS